MERFQKFPYGAVSEIPLWSGFRKFPMKRFQNFLCILFDDHSERASNRSAAKVRGLAENVEVQKG